MAVMGDSESRRTRRAAMKRTLRWIEKRKGMTEDEWLVFVALETQQLSRAEAQVIAASFFVAAVKALAEDDLVETIEAAAEL